MISEKDIAIKYFERLAVNKGDYEMEHSLAVGDAERWALDFILEQEVSKDWSRDKAKSKLRKAIAAWRYKL